jgi:uncharacterized DUF497 family protein
MQFEWDEKKNRSNKMKHGVSFEEAQTVFFDPLTKVAPDPDHSCSEERFIAVGQSAGHRLLLVVHCLREQESVIRIVSARKLTSSERKQFEEGL